MLISTLAGLLCKKCLNLREILVLIIQFANEQCAWTIFDLVLLKFWKELLWTLVWILGQKSTEKWSMKFWNVSLCKQISVWDETLWKIGQKILGQLLYQQFINRIILNHKTSQVHFKHFGSWIWKFYQVYCWFVLLICLFPLGRCCNFFVCSMV